MHRCSFQAKGKVAELSSAVTRLEASVADAEKRLQAEKASIQSLLARERDDTTRQLNGKFEEEKAAWKRREQEALKERETERERWQEAERKHQAGAADLEKTLKSREKELRNLQKKFDEAHVSDGTTSFGGFREFIWCLCNVLGCVVVSGSMMSTSDTLSSSTTSK